MKNIKLVLILFVLLIVCFLTLLLGGYLLLTKSTNTVFSNKVQFNILSGSENQDLEPILNKFALDNNVELKLNYLGSIDILQKLNENSTHDVDAVWPASSVILNISDNKNLKSTQSILKTPIVLGVKKSIAQKLGWTNKDVSVADLLDALSLGKFKLAMTNPTQSNSGFSGYMSFLYAFSGNPDVLSLDNISDSTVQLKTSQLLKSISKTSGSSGWLKDSFLQNYDSSDAMINYEDLIIQTNQVLVQQNKDPLYVIYLKDGLVFADSPLAYLDNNNSTKAEFFNKLQQYLLSKNVQDQLLSTGRRVGIGANLQNYDKKIFNADWGVKAQIDYTTLKYPKKEVINQMLNTYQLSLRKPSFTVYVLDVSGSMEGNGINQLKTSLHNLIDQKIAEKNYLQTGPNDVSILIPFNNNILSTQRFTGNSQDQLNQFSAAVDQLQADGGTNIYSPLAKAMQIIKNEPNIEKYFPSIITMTDGMSNIGDLSEINNEGIPVFPIMFGDADPSQLKLIVDKTGGKLFDGRIDLIQAFKNAKGYN